MRAALLLTIGVITIIGWACQTTSPAQTASWNGSVTALSSPVISPAQAEERDALVARRGAWQPAGRIVTIDELCPQNPRKCFMERWRYGLRAAALGFSAHRLVLGRSNQANTLSARFAYDIVP